MKKYAWRQTGRLICLSVVAVVSVTMASLLVAGADGGGGDTPAWAAPAATTVRKVSQAAGPQQTSNLLQNVDCTTVTYRLTDSGTMRSGCFTETGFGMFDTDHETAIFNGTDEGVWLAGYTGSQVLAAWPESGDLVSLMPVSTGGDIIGLYTNPLAVLHDERGLGGVLVAKQLSAPPDMTLKDPSGKYLVINP
ncbi:MAG TPA: hypothetical protein VHA37_02205, partial [Candidatus Saccharimonadales bacterium]|nr:hypothetical protein [Candidatus Saccharimonadales bacterium]